MNVSVEIPYGASVEDLVPEAGCETAILEHELQTLLQWSNEEQVERICRAAVLLQMVNPDAKFTACLCTAIMWDTAA